MIAPRDVFAEMRQRWLANDVTFEPDQLADEAVLEMPMAAPGRPTRVQGRAQILDFTRAGRAALPIRFDDCRNVIVHQTTDPEVIVVEYELVATVPATGVTASAPFVGVLRARGGKLLHWREYQPTYTIMQALGPA
ncbi:nuclear transport factor 2 family protein [Plantactinospora sonchi]|uniref:Nuclear transport factor 2 family protein n=1 Tax=Plantactinospora sonchi TaxID=1544735 RepID=A0ABU7RRT2_9ACTN